MTNNVLLIGAIIVVLGSTIPYSQCQNSGLFHYTTREGFDGIRASNGILASTRPTDARFGHGVYFTSVRPDAGEDVIYLNNYGGKRMPTPEMKRKIEYYFEFDPALVTAAGGFQVPDTRNIWIHLGDVNFNTLPYKDAGRRITWTA